MQIFRLIKKVCFLGLTILSNFTNALDCISMKNSEYKVRPEIIRLKKLIDKRVCDKGFIWNPSNCECECDKSCDVNEYLNYSDYECKKK